MRIFHDAVRLALIADVAALDRANYAPYLDRPLAETRAALGVDEALLRAYYAIEKRRYPGAPESQRLLD